MLSGASSTAYRFTVPTSHASDTGSNPVAPQILKDLPKVSSVSNIKSSQGFSRGQKFCSPGVWKTALRVTSSSMAAAVAAPRRTVSD